MSHASHDMDAGARRGRQARSTASSAAPAPTSAEITGSSPNPGRGPNLPCRAPLRSRIRRTRSRCVTLPHLRRPPPAHELAQVPWPRSGVRRQEQKLANREAPPARSGGAMEQKPLPTEVAGVVLALLLDLLPGGCGGAPPVEVAMPAAHVPGEVCPEPELPEAFPPAPPPNLCPSSGSRARMGWLWCPRPRSGVPHPRLRPVSRAPTTPQRRPICWPGSRARTGCHRQDALFFFLFYIFSFNDRRTPLV